MRKILGLKPLTGAERSRQKRLRKAIRERQLITALELIRSDQTQTLQEARAIAAATLSETLMGVKL